MQKQKNGDAEAGSFTYDYYANGNVKQIKSGSTVKVAYEYDEFNRLIAEINYAAGKKFAYTYDSAGNVLTKHTYNITNNVIAAVASDVTTYGYTNPLWRDQLTKIDNRYTIEYDAAGNPVKYKDYALEWKGNRLTKFDNTTFAYDINGLRVKKNDTHYYLSGDKIIVERRVEDGAVKFVYYRYDDSGVCGMNYDGTDYYFRKNIFGDIIEVFASDGTSVASFVYDAYGKVLTESGTMASKVPFRYRGYYYDQETRLYYLQSRYYDPATGRFISPDSIEYLAPAVIHGLNLYAYCGNNPVMNVDPDGTFGILALFAIAALIGAAVGVGVSAYKDYTDDGELFNGSVSWKEYLYNAAFFACVAVFVVATLPYTASLAGSLTFGGAMFGGGGAAVMGTSLVISGATVIGTVQVLSAAGALGILLSSHKTSKHDGYWAEKYVVDHEPEHVHFKGTDRTNIKIGRDGQPIKGQPSLNSKQRRALRYLWDEIVKLFMERFS